MCEVRSREKRAGTKKIKYNGQQQKEMDCHEPHPTPNEKTQPIQWTERPTGALVAVNSLWPPHGMIESQYPANIGINLILMASNPFATMREKILFHAITCHEQFFYSDKLSQNFALCWGGATTDRSF